MIIEKISDALQLSLQKKITLQEKAKKERQKINRASDVGWLNDCPRFLVLKQLCPEKEKINTLERQQRLEEGNYQHCIMKMELEEAGVEFVPREKIKPLYIPKLRLKGEVDDIIKVNGMFAVVDYKTSSSGVFREVKRYATAEDLIHSKLFWLRHNPWQALVYLVMNQLPVALLLYKNLDTGEKHLIEVVQEIQKFRFIEEKLTWINDCVEKEDVPTVINNALICKRCGFEDSVCYEEKEKPCDITNYDEPELEMLLIERQEMIDQGIEAQAKRLEELTDEIKSKVKYIGEKLLIGDFKIINTSYQKKIHKVPEEIKKQFEEEMEIIRTNIKFLGSPL